MAVPFAQVTDLAVRWRPLSSDEETRAAVLLSDASDMVRDAFPDAEARVAAGTLSESALVRVVVGMVKRMMANPEGERQHSIDDYTRILNPEASAGYMFLSANDRAALEPVRRRRAFVVDLG